MVNCSVVNPHWFECDPDLAFNLNADPDPDPDPRRQTNVDQSDPNPDQTLKSQKGNRSKNILTKPQKPF
jgi:hypothetical protein